MTPTQGLSDRKIELNLKNVLDVHNKVVYNHR